MSDAGRKRSARWFAAVGAHLETILPECYDTPALEGISARYSFQQWEQAQRDEAKCVAESLIQSAIDRAIWNELPMSACIVLVYNQISRIIPSGWKWRFEMDSEYGLAVRWWMPGQSFSDTPAGRCGDVDYQLLVSMLSQRDWSKEKPPLAPSHPISKSPVADDPFERARQEILRKRAGLAS